MSPKPRDDSTLLANAASLIQPVWVIGFSGHRPGRAPGRTAAVLDTTDNAIRKVLADLRKAAATANGRIVLLTSPAAGADLEAIDAANALGISVHLILPLAEEDFLKDFGPQESAARAKAEAAIVAARRGDGSATLRFSDSLASRPACYYDAGIKLLAECDLLLAVWDGELARGLGGTADLVKHAERLGKPVIQINPADENRITRSPEALRWPPADPVVQEMNALLAEAPSFAASEDVAERVFLGLDNVANRRSTRYRGLLLVGIALQFLAAAIAMLNSATEPFTRGAGPLIAWTGGQSASAGTPLVGVDTVELLLIVEFVLVATAGVLLWRARRARIKEQWRQARFGAEIVRGLRASAGFLDPLDPLVARHTPEWKRFAVTLALAARERASLAGLPQARATYLSGRIEHQRDQYFEKEQVTAARWAGTLGVIGRIASAAAPLVVLAAFGARLMYPQWGSTRYEGALVAKFIPAFLPLLAGAATSLSLAKDATRRAERYRQMRERLDGLARGFAGLQTETMVQRSVAATEEVLLDELVEWYLAGRKAP